MPASLIFGKMGSNKTHFATFYALFLANKLHKKVVLNYLLHPDNLMQYCSKMGYSWLCEALSKDEPIIYYCDIENGGIDYILSIDDSVISFDEVALYVPSRGSGSVTTKSSKFHKDLTQIRHRHNYLIVIAQNHQQIDSAIKNLAEETFHCAGLTSYDDDLKSEKLWYKIVDRFVPDNYELWIGNPRLRRNPLKTKLMSNKSFSGMLTSADADLFNVYQSFGLVHDIRLSEAFSDSWVTYHKEVSRDKNLFTWAYILPLKSVPIKSKLFTCFYTKLPSSYYLVGNLIYNRYLESLYTSSSNKNLDRLVLCLFFVLGLILFLLVIKNFWFMLSLSFLAFFFMRFRASLKLPVIS